MKVRSTAVVALAALGAVLSGCAVTRSEVKIGAQPVETAVPDAARAPIVIGSVVDARKFESAPKDPSIPSLGTEGGGDDAKARAVGRKRNTYGMALGDVLLEPGNSVANVVRRQLTIALGQAGYRVVEAGAEKAAPVVDVSIHQFWNWITPGFWAITVSTLVATDFTVQGRAAPVSIVVRNAEPSLAVTDGVWMEAIEKSLARWRAEVVARKAELP